MCGITSFLTVGAPQDRQSVGREQTEHTIEESLHIVRHRGPDASGKWISSDCRVGLGHVRLSIVDLSADGNQPFHDTESEIYAVVNGELYDHERYREQLMEEHKFQGKSDCEIVLALYKHYGLNFLSHLRGEFALVLWDAKRELFLATRDRYGIKSLYYTVVGGRLLVATEMKQFLAYGWEPTWDVRSICEHGWVNDTRTVFQGVRKILPGQYLVCKNYGEIQTEKYWDMQYPDKHVKETRTEDEMREEVQKRLLEAVRVRLRADVPVGVYLSGGIDSSVIAGMVVHLVKEGMKIGDDTTGDLSRIQCFTVQFDKNSGVDESDVAQRTADWLGVQFNPVHMDEEAIASRLEDVVWHSEAIMGDVNATGKLALSEAAHQKGFKVVITGEGSDEHFAGYSYFNSEALLETDHAWETPGFTESGRQQALEDRQATSIAGIRFMATETTPSTLRMLNKTRFPSLLAKMTPLFFEPWIEVYRKVDRPTVLAESVSGEVRDAIANKWHPLHTSEYLWTKSAFANALLRYLGDNVDMVHQMESRTPFLDHHLTEYVNGLPPSLKMKYDYETRSFCEKYILREAVKPFVTEEIYKRKKQPYIGPAHFAADGPVHRKFREIVTEENIKQLGFVDWKQTELMLRKTLEENDPLAARAVMIAAQFVVLSQRFGVKKATPPVSFNGSV